jgi:hypothetical protein
MGASKSRMIIICPHFLDCQHVTPIQHILFTKNCDSCVVNETTFTFQTLQRTNDSLAFERATVLVIY